MSLVELLLAIAIGGMVMAAMASLCLYTGRSFAAIANYVDLDQSTRGTLDLMSQQIRQTARLVQGDAQNLVFEDYDGKLLQFQYNPSARTLTRSKQGEDTTVLLRGCDELAFSIFQRNPVGGSYNVYPTATPATCKVVQLRWVCSRDLIRARVNTESVQSSKIVIRRQ